LAPFPGASGVRYFCDLRNELMRDVFFTGQYEPQETSLLRKLIEPGQVFVDVGAHWGYFSLIASERVGASGRVIAVEADPRIFALLKTNLAINTLPNMEAIQVAVAAAPESMTMAGYAEGTGNWGISRLVPAGASPEISFKVATESLDGILDRLSVPIADWVKMDIEGAEGFALAGMAHGLAAHRYRRIVLELHPVQLRSHGHDAAAIIALLERAGYRGYTIDHSPTATRRAAYGQVSALALLRPIAATALDAWPHTLWTAPGVELSP
jgi:FkbM family methyltransferase